MDDEKLYCLSKIDFFMELNQQEMMELAREFQWVSYPIGLIILEQGKRPNSLYILCEGSVEVLGTNEEQRTRQTFGSGKVFGELSLVTGKPSQNTVRCLENSRVLTISAEDFARILLRWPQIYRTIIGQLTDNLNEANQMLSESKYKEVLRSAISLTQYRDKFYGIWGSVRTTKEVERKLEELEQRDGHLLISGERGTGRQMVAWYAHQRLFGELAPFVVVDGRRFGQQWGSMYHSLFDIAMTGTLLIQEIDHISPSIQLKLAKALKVSKNKCLVIGSLQKQPKPTGQKIIPELQECFTHSYTITPLRERKRDIPILAHGILEKLALKNHRNIPNLSPEATQLILSHHYRQGNVTELIQVMERAFYLAKADVIGLEQIFFGPTSEKIGRNIKLLQWESIENFFRKGTAILWARWISAVMFGFLIFGLLCIPHITLTTKVFALVWGLWWPALAIISPFLGRIWCTVCPFSTIMDFVQNKFNPKRPVPALLIKYDYLIVSALFLLIFWVEIIAHMRSNPFYTGLLLITIQLAAISISILYPRHAWCRHFCPLGGFIGTASIGSILEVRADASVCLNKCTTFECYMGTDKVKGCPMSQHLPYLDNNLDCKLCFNCVRNCPHGSVQVNLRVPAREVWHLTRVNQGYSVFIGVMIAILFPIIYLEPFQKSWPSGEWNMWFTIAYFTSAILGGASGWWIGKPFKTKAASTRIKLVFAFIPLVIAGHIIYQVSFIPGIKALVLGIGYQTSSGLRSVFISATLAAQVIATLIGLALTSITMTIVLLRKKQKLAEKARE
jgi:transcriptional regulator with AAA-type ATPase domain/NAD-dependent dihydropyrimidine dehydrogenase PreA subunit